MHWPAVRRWPAGRRWRVVRALLVSALLVPLVGAEAAGGAPAPVSSARSRTTAVDLTRSDRRAVPPEQGARWTWPVASPAVTTPYAAPPTRYAAGHRGIDLTAARDSPVLAPDGAIVRFAGMVVDRPVLTLDHGGGVLSSFEPVSSNLPVGSPVVRGATIGVVASGGHCGTECVHVGVRVDGEYVSPMLFFGRVPPAILLPLGDG